MNYNLEKQLLSDGYKLVAAIDEAGRGPLAGPVVAACVIIDKDFDFNIEEWKLINDSKKLTAKKREYLFKLIREKFLAVEIGVVNEKIIDKINILQASFLAMRKALINTKITPDIVLVDGKFKIPKVAIPQKSIIHGDAIVFAIAAASIIAKVSRDYLMTELDKKYPEYLFAKHKGYGTKDHLDKILAHGPCPIHRQSFAPIKDMLRK